MRRNALRAFFERVVVASLPLAAGCGGQGAHDTGLSAGADLAVADDLSAPVPAADLALVDGAPPRLDTCENLHPPVSIDFPPSGFPDGGADCHSGTMCTNVCPPGYIICCGPNVPDGGAPSLICYYYCGPAGRRPSGLQEAYADGGCDLGRHFARMAHLEAASVHAFRVLASELIANGAPPHLVRAARKAARDEVRHARLTARIARAHGGVAAKVQVARSRTRSLEEIAVENAAEGCVRETFGALLATWQARSAADPSIAGAMAEIARDETAHAELAWAVDAWAATKLDRVARRRVADARRAAAAELVAEIAEPPSALRAAAGLPSAAQARTFIAEATAELWG
jgi:hypothetical protein